MSKTMDELVDEFLKHWLAHGRMEDDIRAGIAAVVRALRDEIVEDGDCKYCVATTAMYNQILGAAGEKVAGVLAVESREGAMISEAPEAPATDPAPAVCEYRNAFVAHENRNWRRRKCDGEVVYREAPGHCLYCGLPIKFTEAKT